MIARLAPSIPLVRRTAAIGVVSLFVTRLAKVGNPPVADHLDCALRECTNRPAS